MPPVMDTSVKVGTRSYGQSDAKLPALGSRIPFNGAPAFQEWDEVTGNIQRNIRGNLTYYQIGDILSFLDGNLDETVSKDHVDTLLGSLTSTVVQKTNKTNLGPHLQLNGSTRTENFTGIVTRSYQANLIETHPESWIQYFKDCFHRYDLRFTLYDILKLDICTAATSVNGLKFDVSLVKGDIAPTKLKTSAIEAKICAAQHKIHIAAAKMLCTGMLIGLLYLGTPLKPNALPAPTPITPFD